MFTLDAIVPWGRSFDEYRRMFALSDDDLTRRMVGCGDGPASFNAEMTRHGGRIVSCDPLYQFDGAQIRQRIDETSAEVLAQARENAHEFVWDDAIPDVDALKRVRMAAMATFLDDYEQGRRAGRYLDAELPALPFPSCTFDLALCSHFLFLYSTHHGVAFHVFSIEELCRVANEVRVFPLLALGGQPSQHVAPVTTALQDRGFTVTIERVPYEFQRGGNEMMRVRL